jgi:hypothetical protein
MGTQQMLLIALGVIIVGISVSVGITLFFNQSYNSNKQSLAAEMAAYRPMAVRYWKTSKLLGGAGGDVNNVTIESVANYIGFTDTLYSLTSANGEFRVIGVNGTVVTLKALGAETRRGKHPSVASTLNIANGVITTVLGDATGW